MSANPLYRFLSIAGMVFDALKSDAESLQQLYNVESGDLTLLPYIDALVGWPTGLGLDTDTRRIETLQSATIWRTKGRTSALEAVVQTVAGWDATPYEGWRYVMFSNTARCTTPDMASLNVGAIGTEDDELFYTPTQENWHCLNGLGLVLTPVEGLSDTLAADTLARVKELEEYVLTSWAILSLLVSFLVEDEAVPAPVEFEDTALIASYHAELTVPDPTEASWAEWGGVLLMASNTSTRTANTPTVRVHHSGLGYSGTAPPPPYTAGP